MPSLDTWQWPLTDQLVQSGLINSTSWITIEHGQFIIKYAFSSLVFTRNKLHDVRYSQKSWMLDDIKYIRNKLDEKTSPQSLHRTFIDPLYGVNWVIKCWAKTDFRKRPNFRRDYPTESNDYMLKPVFASISFHTKSLWAPDCKTSWSKPAFLYVKNNCWFLWWMWSTQ